MIIREGDTVVFEYTGWISENKIFDTSRESVAEESGLPDYQEDREEFEPVTTTIGEGELLEGLEEALIGRKEGESFSITIPPEKGYGEWTEEDVREFDVDELEEMIGGYTPVEGGELETVDGRPVEIIEIEDGIARVDFNNPLRGETLKFDIEILEMKR